MGLEEELPWEDFNRLHVIKRLRELIGDLWKIQINFTDQRGYLRGVKAGQFFNPIHQVCKRVAKDDRGFQGCMTAVRRTGIHKSAQATFDQCHAGFSTISIPITIRGKYLGSVFGDGFITAETQDQQTVTIKEKLRFLFPTEEELQEHVSKIPVLTEKEIKYLTQLVEMLVDEILVVYANYWTSRDEVLALKTQLLTRYDFSNMVGKSNAMQQLYSLIDRVKDSGATVLIQGENGTGKELIARALHYNSKRKTNPFITVNCGAFNESLLESELFGHLKGSFTGAVKDKIGLFEAANGGTLFLDEIAETSMVMQVKLLRVLQDGTFRPVGSNETRQSTARVLCASNQDLTVMVESGQFRKDLYFRLNVINLYVPPLRERAEDIPLLIEFFVKKFSESMQTAEKYPNKECLKRLFNYSWPGNVRELENELERLYVLAGQESVLSEENLSARLSEKGPARLSTGESLKLKDALEQVEFEMIRDGLKRTQWNKSLLAKELGISRAGLILKVEKYGLGRKAG